MDKKHKNQDAHEVLDRAINELHRALHTMLDVVQAQRENHYQNVEVIEQASFMVGTLYRQVQLIVMPNYVQELLNQRHELQVIEMERVLSQYKLTELTTALADASTEGAGE